MVYNCSTVYSIFIQWTNFEGMKIEFGIVMLYSPLRNS